MEPRRPELHTSCSAIDRAVILLMAPAWLMNRILVAPKDVPLSMGSLLAHIVQQAAPRFASTTMLALIGVTSIVAASTPLLRTGSLGDQCVHYVSVHQAAVVAVAVLLM